MKKREKKGTKKSWKQREEGRKHEREERKGNYKKI
jgi:hypothetical protein